MSKQKYLVFTNNRMPRVLTNPSAADLAKLDKSQVIKQPKSYLRNVPLEELVLEEGALRRLHKNDDKVDLNKRPINAEGIMREEIESKLKEVMGMIKDQDKLLIAYMDEVEEMKRKNVWKRIAIASLLVNAACSVPIFNMLRPLVESIIK